MPLFTTLPNALGHLNSLFGGDNWAKCSTVMHPVGLLVACFPWWIGLLFGQRFGGHYLSADAPSNIYVLPHWPSSGTPNPGRRNIVFLNLKNPKNLYLRKSRSRAKSERRAEGRRRSSFSEQWKDKPAFWVQKEAGRQGARRYLCSTWLRSKMTADGCRADIMDEQMWRQLSKCSNT